MERLFSLFSTTGILMHFWGAIRRAKLGPRLQFLKYLALEKSRFGNHAELKTEPRRKFAQKGVLIGFLLCCGCAIDFMNNELVV